MADRLISAYDRVQEHPRVWTERLSKTRWGSRIPHVERAADGLERWVVDGQPLHMHGVAVCGAVMADRNQDPRLKVVFAESGLEWAAYLLEYADHQFEKDRLGQEGYDLKPSELLRRQCYLTASYDCDSLQTRAYIAPSGAAVAEKPHTTLLMPPVPTTNTR